MRLTSAEIAIHKAELAQWQSPLIMLKGVNALMRQLGGKDMFNQSGLEFVRDVWLAATFAELRGAERVRLVANDRPDFELRLTTGINEAFEAVEADEEGRTRGLEYRNKQRITDWPVEEWATPNQAFSTLQAAATKKAKRAAELAAAGRPYPPGTGLVIYLNLEEFGIHQKEIETLFPSAVQSAANRFASIWILWKRKAYHAAGGDSIQLRS